MQQPGSVCSPQKAGETLNLPRQSMLCPSGRISRSTGKKTDLDAEGFAILLLIASIVGPRAGGRIKLNDARARVCAADQRALPAHLWRFPASRDGRSGDNMIQTGMRLPEAPWPRSRAMLYATTMRMQRQRHLLWRMILTPSAQSAQRSARKTNATS